MILGPVGTALGGDSTSGVIISIFILMRRQYLYDSDLFVCSVDIKNVEMSTYLAKS